MGGTGSEVSTEPPAIPSFGRVVVDALALGVLVLVAEAIAEVVAGWPARELPFVAVAAPLGLVAAVVHSRFVRRRHPRASMGSYLAAVSLSPVVAMAGAGALTDPIVGGTNFCGTA